MAYSDYTFYSTEYNGALVEADYNHLSPRALAWIDRYTFNRAKTETAHANEIKMAECAVIDVLYKIEQGGELSGQTVGGWSKSYATSGKSNEKKIYDSIELYLGMTGLMYQGGCNV